MEKDIQQDNITLSNEVKKYIIYFSGMVLESLNAKGDDLKNDARLALRDPMCKCYISAFTYLVQCIKKQYTNLTSDHNYLIEQIAVDFLKSRV